MRIRTLFTTIAIAALASVASIAQDDAYSFKPILKKDDAFHYKVVGQFDLQGQTIDFTAKLLQKVSAVETDGGYSFDQKQTEPHVTVGGQEQPIPDDETVVTFKFKPTGELAELKCTDEKFTGPEAYRAAALETFLMPPNPAKVGDTWSYKTDAVANKWKKTQIDFKLEGTEKVGDVDCVKVSFDSKELEGGDEAATEKGMLWLAKADFSMIKRDAKVTNLPLPGAPVALTGTMKIEKDTTPVSLPTPVKTGR